jgi:hypothetical protein
MRPRSSMKQRRRDGLDIVDHCSTVDSTAHRISWPQRIFDTSHWLLRCDPAKRRLAGQGGQAFRLKGQIYCPWEIAQLECTPSSHYPLVKLEYFQARRGKSS